MTSCTDLGPPPDFILGGAPKCGTTALFAYLGQHDAVFTPSLKEPHYFATAPLGRRVMQADLSAAEYQALFLSRRRGQRTGEASTHYLHLADAVAPFMATAAPAARLVFCLRDPVDRAYSHYLYRYSTAGPDTPGGVGRRSSFKAFAMTPEIFLIGNYARHLSVFLDYFDASQILVILFDDLRRDLPGSLAQVCCHIGVDERFAFDLSDRHNETEYARWPLAMPVFDRLAQALYWQLPGPHQQKIIRLRRRLLFRNGTKPRLPTAERNAVAASYRPSVRELAALIGRDLSSWCAAGSAGEAETGCRADEASEERSAPSGSPADHE